MRPSARSDGEGGEECGGGTPTDEPPPTSKVSATLKELVRSVSEHTLTGH